VTAAGNLADRNRGSSGDEDQQAPGRTFTGATNQVLGIGDAMPGIRGVDRGLRA